MSQLKAWRELFVALRLGGAAGIDRWSTGKPPVEFLRVHGSNAPATIAGAVPLYYKREQVETIQVVHASPGDAMRVAHLTTRDVTVVLGTPGSPAYVYDPRRGVIETGAVFFQCTVCGFVAVWPDPRNQHLCGAFERGCRGEMLPVSPTRPNSMSASRDPLRELLRRLWYNRVGACTPFANSLRLTPADAAELERLIGEGV